jgi:hypothetical protein
MPLPTYNLLELGNMPFDFYGMGAAAGLDPSDDRYCAGAA